MNFDAEAEENEFWEDFGTEGLSEAELDSLLHRARETQDRELRLLVKQFHALRWISEAMLTQIENGEASSLPPNFALLRIARFLIRGERN